MGELYIEPDLYLDSETQRIYKGEKWTSMSLDMCNVLRCLVEHKGKLCTHMDLALAMWPDIKTDTLTSEDTGRIKKVVFDTKARLSRVTCIPQTQWNERITGVRGKGYIYEGCPESKKKSMSGIQYTHEQRRQFDEKRLYEYCGTLETLCGSLYSADKLEHIAETRQYLKNNVDSFCRKLERYISIFHLSMTEAESVCSDYIIDIESRLQYKAQAGAGDPEDELAREKPRALR